MGRFSVEDSDLGMEKDSVETDSWFDVESLGSSGSVLELESDLARTSAYAVS
jgi:hypothetical protein